MAQDARLSHARSDFGDGFLFGAATAAYQVEGGQTDGRGASIWDSFSATPGNVYEQHSGQYACDHYRLWPRDLDLVREAGFDAYRFSFAWPRLIPEGRGASNEKGVAFYDRLIDGMLERGLKPFATLYHWDLPSALQDEGGWMNRDIADWFADYAALVGERFGDRLASIATVNEPWCVAHLGHMSGIHAPGYRDLRAGARAMHHVLLAHAAGMEALRAQNLSQLGIVLNITVTEPAGPGAIDLAASHRADGMFNRWYLDALFKKSYPDDILQVVGPHLPEGFEKDLPRIGQPLDWLGINYYTRALIEHAPGMGIYDCGAIEGPLPKTDMGWEVYPKGLERLLHRIAGEYTRIPLYVTENGMANGHGVEDPERIAYFDAHLAAVLAAKKAGVDLRGYFAWSLLDNFEWAEGYSKRFGLVEVDYADQSRTPRESYHAFRKMLRDGA